MKEFLPFVLSAVTLLSMWLAGNKRPSAWLVGLGNQVLWAWWIVLMEAWGLLPLCVALTFIYSRNWLKWRMDE